MCRDRPHAATCDRIICWIDAAESGEISSGRMPWTTNAVKTMKEQKSLMPLEGDGRGDCECARRAIGAGIGELGPALERHRQWLGSGWESGKRADLHGRDLHATDLCGVLLTDADLHRCDLHQAMLVGAELDGADLHRADLHGAHLSHADLQWADLHEADLHDADLSGAVLEEADLHRADLHAADLTDARLYGADLRGADLRGADLRGADLRGARGLTVAQVSDATTDASTRLPGGMQPASR